MANHFQFDFDPSDFSIDLCVSCGQVFRWKRIDDRQWKGVEGDHWFEVMQTEVDRLEVHSSATRADFEKLFRFDWSGPTVRGRMIELGPELQPYVEALPGLRLMRPSSRVETFFCFLCTPNNHLNRITSMIATLGSYGTPLQDAPEYRRFPNVEEIASIPEPELRGKGFGYRGATIPKAAKELLDLGGEKYLDLLSLATYEQAQTALCKISGIGPKLADCIALFALDHTSAVPIDTHLWQAATRLYFPEWQNTNLTSVKYRQIGDFMRTRFGNLAGYAHQYMFFENLLNWRERKAATS